MNGTELLARFTELAQSGASGAAHADSVVRDLGGDKETMVLLNELMSQLEPGHFSTFAELFSYAFFLGWILRGINETPVSQEKKEIDHDPTNRSF